MADGDDDVSIVPDLPEGVKGGKLARSALNIAGGAIPFFGGLLSAAANAWSEREQERLNAFLHQWLRMLAAEMQEKEQTILEISARLDMKDEDVAKRIESPDFVQAAVPRSQYWRHRSAAPRNGLCG